MSWCATLQQQHKEWLDREFPTQTPEWAALGCLEEAGELVHCVLKAAQENVWGHDPRHSEHWGEELLDAIGDCGIFAVSLCNSARWSFTRTMKDAETDAAAWPERPAFQSAPEVVRAAAELALHPTSRAHLTVFLSCLLAFSQAAGVDLRVAVETTWAQVRERRRGVQPVT